MKNTPLKLNQKLLEFQYSELNKVNATYKPLIEEAKKKKDTAYTILLSAIKKTKPQDRPLTPEEKKLERIYLNADKEYRDLIEDWHNEQTHAKIQAEELTFTFFSKDTATTIDMLKHDIPLQIAIAALTVMDLPLEQEYKLFTEKNNTSPNSTTSEAEKTIFSDEILRVRLHQIFKRFICFLQENDTEGFLTACELIEKGIENKKKILTDVRTLLISVFEEENPQKKREKQEDTIKTNTHLAKEVISGTTKLEQVIFDQRKNPVFYDTNITAVDINVGNRGKNTITTIASIDFNNMKKMGVSISHEKWLTPFDREILSIVSSLYAAGNTYQSPQMIFQAMSGNKEKVKLPPEMRAKIIESLRKLRATTIEINASQEEKAGWSKKGKYEGSLLPSERVEVITLNGQKVVDCIHFLRNSPLYDYAEGKNQISRVNIEMLQAPVNNTTENIELKFYLLRLISSMKNSKSKLKPVIRYDSLYEYLGIDENNTSDILHKKKDIRDRVKKILNFWVEQGFIRSFEEEKEGKNIAKVKISL